MESPSKFQAVHRWDVTILMGNWDAKVGKGKWTTMMLHDHHHRGTPSSISTPSTYTRGSVQAAGWGNRETTCCLGGDRELNWLTWRLDPLQTAGAIINSCIQQSEWAWNPRKNKTRHQNITEQGSQSSSQMKSRTVLHPYWTRARIGDLQQSSRSPNIEKWSNHGYGMRRWKLWWKEEWLKWVEIMMNGDVWTRSPPNIPQ